jgi:Zn-dependent protease
MQHLSAAQLYDALLAYLIVIASLTLHEWGHAITTDRLGDDTPRSQGRVTLNPLAHIDLFGTVILPLLGIFGNLPIIGWAKPVIINPANLPKTSDRAWVTIAGPAMNLFLALISAIALGLCLRFSPSWNVAPLFALMLQINVALMVFNLIPVPPLDGSKFLMYWFGMTPQTYVQFARFGWIILMVLINIPQTRNVFAHMISATLQPFILLASWLR